MEQPAGQDFQAILDSLVARHLHEVAEAGDQDGLFPGCNLKARKCHEVSIFLHIFSGLQDPTKIPSNYSKIASIQGQQKQVAHFARFKQKMQPFASRSRLTMADWNAIPQENYYT